MTIIDITPHLKTAPPADKRAQIEALAAELGGVVLWPDETPAPADLTPREQDLWKMLGRRPRTSRALAIELYVSYRWCCVLLSRLQLKGYAERTGRHNDGTWIRTDPAQARPTAIAA